MSEQKAFKMTAYSTEVKPKKAWITVDDVMLYKREVDKRINELEAQLAEQTDWNKKFVQLPNEENQKLRDVINGLGIQRDDLIRRVTELAHECKMELAIKKALGDRINELEEALQESIPYLELLALTEEDSEGAVTEVIVNCTQALKGG